MLLLGSALDLDFIGNFLRILGPLFEHHGIVHSIIGTAALSLLFSWILIRLDPGPFHVRLAHYSFVLYLHLLGDFLTIYGVPLFAPFTFRNISADLIQGFALGPLFIAGGGLLWLLHGKKAGARATAPFWGLLVVYLLMTASMKSFAGHVVGDERGKVTALPALLRPLTSWVVEEDRAERLYRWYSVGLFDQKPRLLKVYSMIPEKEPLNKVGLESEWVQRFLGRNRWPVMRVVASDSGRQVEWGHLVFSTLGDVRVKIVLRFDDKGNIIGQKKVVDFWSQESS